MRAARKWRAGGRGQPNDFFFLAYFYKDVMRGSVATERDFFCNFISLNAALLGLPEPKSVLQSLFSIYYTICFALFQISRGGGRSPPLKNWGGDVSPPPRPPGDRRPWPWWSHSPATCWQIKQILIPEGTR